MAWSAFLGSTPRRICRSTDASNFVVFTSLTSNEASFREYILFLSTLESTAFLFFAIPIVIQFYPLQLIFVPWCVTIYGKAHTACGTCNHFHGTFNSKAVKISHFIFGDIFHLLPVHFTH